MSEFIIKPQNTNIIKIMIYIAVIVLLIIIAFFLIPRTDITIYVDYSTYSGSSILTLKENNNIDYNNKILPIKIVNISELSHYNKNEYYIDQNNFSNSENTKIAIFNKNDLNTIIYHLAKSEIPNNKVIFSTKKLPYLNIEIINADFNKKNISINVKYEVYVIPDYDLNGIKSQLVNLPYHDAQTLLAKIPGVKNVDIKNLYNFSEKMPITDKRIYLHIELNQ